ncbi:response regulator [Arcicella aquatica]|uniref:Response regulator n=1 Tax=Arcicella aquatica TaxID=217141 RepID=A0ABU5QGV5_9BACT|nr:response regulator [Arcicella aquatica]MEA5256283.1 response regulator [Arcicella aquatica]
MPNNSIALIVDDEHLNRFLMRKYLQSCNIPFDEVTDGQEAIEWIKNSEHDKIIVLLDLNMPVMDGYEFLEYTVDNYFEFKEKKILTIVVSASDYTVFRQNAPHAEIIKYLSKPVGKEALYEAILQAQEYFNAIV